MNACAYVNIFSFFLVHGDDSNSCTCRCRFPRPSTSECLSAAPEWQLSRWHCISGKNWGTEWESVLQVPRPHRCERSIFWLQFMKIKNEKHFVPNRATNVHICHPAEKKLRWESGWKSFVRPRLGGTHSFVWVHSTLTFPPVLINTKAKIYKWKEDQRHK